MWLIVACGFAAKLFVNKNILIIQQILPVVMFCFVITINLHTKVAKSKLAALVALLFVWILLSALFSIDKSLAIASTVSKYAPLLLVFLGAYYFCGNIAMNLFISAIQQAGIVSAIISIIQITIGFPHYETEWAHVIGNVHGVDIFISSARRATGLYIYSADNALALSCSLLSYLTFSPKKKIIHIAIIIIGILVSQTRAVWIASVIASCLIIIKLNSTKKHSFRKITFSLMLIGACIGLAKEYIHPIAERFDSFSGMFTDPQHPFMFRLLFVWPPLIQTAIHHPFGIGPGQVLSVDNMYLQILVSFGIIGALLFFSTFIIAFVHSLNCYDLWQSKFHLMVASLILMIGTASITGDCLLTCPINSFLYLAIGMSIFGSRATT